MMHYLMFVLFGLLALQGPRSGRSGTLIVEVEGLKNDRGVVQIGLFDNPQSFAGKGKKVTGAQLTIRKGRARWVIDRLPFGDYAIKAFHDEDGDDQLDTNFLGLPSEDFAFSNRARAIFGLPSFEKAKFSFQADSLHVIVSFR